MIDLKKKKKYRSRFGQRFKLHVRIIKLRKRSDTDDMRLIKRINAN